MKKLYVFTLLAFLGVQLGIAQYNFDKKWQKVETLELKGKFATAQKLVERIYKEAHKTQETAQIVKSLIYQAKFSLLLTEDTAVEVLQQLRVEIDKQAFPTNAILENMYAKLLTQYMHKHQYKIRKRSKVVSENIPTDIQLWDLKTFVSEIHKHFQHSIANEEALLQLPVEDYMILMEGNETMKMYRSSVYEILVHNALNFYKTEIPYAYNSDEDYTITEDDFALSETFLKRRFQTSSERVFAMSNTLEMFQKLEKAALKNKNVHVAVVLQRFQFLYAQTFNTPEGNSNYVAALLQLAKTYQNNPLEALINYQLADHYVDFFDSYHYKTNEEFKNLYTKAIALTEAMSTTYPNSEGGIKCALLQKRIEEATIKFTTESFSIPDKHTLASVKIKNVDHLFLHVYRTPISFLQSQNNYKRDSLAADFIQRTKPVLQKTYNTNIPKDYQEHTTEISIPPLPKGRYLLVLSNNKNGQAANSVVTYNSIQKTNLAEFITEFNDKEMHTIVHRATGKPIYQAKIKIADKKGLVNQIERTNIYGHAYINKRSNYKTVEKLITHQGDTLYTKAASLNQKYTKEDNAHWEAKPFVFTDRAIYRPGQTVHFKVVLIQQKNGVSSVVPNVYCEVEIEPEGNDSKIMRLQTNAFGSFSGSYKIPKNATTGEFTIRVDEDIDYEEDEHPFWDNLDEFHYTEHMFKVEAYKRPRFEVIVDALTNNISFNDTIKVTGNARALLGSAVTNAKVAYTVKRLSNLYRRYTDNVKVIAASETRTDEKGNFSIPFVATIEDEVDEEDIYAYQYTVAIEVTDINGETQTTEKIVSVSRKGFNLTVDVPKKNNKKIPLQVGITTKDINNVNVTANGVFKIYKLQNPARILKKRPWATPEYHIIPKETFVQQFPNISYDDAEQQPEKEKLVTQQTFNTGEKSNFTMDASTWESGTYIIETTAYDEKIKDSVTQSQQFLLMGRNDQYLANNTLFTYEIRNGDFRKDDYVYLKLSTALRNEPLHVLVQAFHESEQFFSRIQTIENGNVLLQIPLEKLMTNEITVRMSFVKFNTFYKDEFSFEQYDEKKFLSIETTTFRNKLQPGQSETWQFKILDLEEKGSNAEVLASMYDESLDQFQQHKWNVDFHRFRSKYYDRPRSQAYGFNTRRSHTFYNSKNQYVIPTFKKQLQFNWFGLDLQNSNYRNNQYLKNVKQQRKYQDKTVYNGTISGYVVDESGMPLPGATILIKGTKVGTTTDFDGLYSINANANDTLVVSYVGYKSEKVTVDTQKNINIRLYQGEALQAVTIIGYGGSITTSKVAAVMATINGVSVQTVPTGDLGQMLQGMAAGVNVHTGSSTQGQDAIITIRGKSALQGDIEPLFVVDGVMVDANAFKNLDQNNITSLEVLKDTAATAIYGSKAAAGVIIINTKYGIRKEMIGDTEVIVGVTEEDLDTIETRKNLKETAFFYPHLRTDAEGSVAVTFDVPESMTRWKFQLFAHQKDGLYEMIAKNAVTQKELMVVPNMPRFVREKDTIVISTKVINLQSKATKGIASLRLFDAHTMEPVDAQMHLTEKNKSFSIDAKGNSQLSWKLHIPEGIEAIQYKVIATAGKFSDGEESVLPVLKNSILVTEAKPILVKAGEQKTITFNKLATNTSPTLQQHQLTLEYTSNPTWSAIQSLPYLMEYPYECTEQTFARLYANMIAAHILQSSPKIKEVFEAWKANGALVSDLEKNPELKSLLISETPWIRDAVSETERKQQVAKLFDPKALEEMQLEMRYKLEELQTNSGGFPWFSGGNDNYGITLHILQTFAHLEHLNIHTDISEDALANIIKSAYMYIDRHFMNAYAIASKSSKDEVYASQIEYLYTRTMIADLTAIPEKVEKAIKFCLDNLQKDWLFLSVKQKAMLALSLARMHRKKEAKKIMKALEETAVQSDENGMYWKEITEQRYYNSSAVEIQAVLIEAFAEITSDKKIVQELQLWLLQQKQRNQWKTTKATTKAIYALLLHPNPFVSLKDNTKFTIGTEKISSKKLDETQKEAGTGYFKTTWTKEEVTKDKATISVKNKGKTTGFGAAYWQYFEELDNVTQSETSTLQVSKELYVKETMQGEETLVPISKRTVQIGDKITVRLTIRNAKDVEFIHLKDLRAAGLEPMDVLSEYKWQDGVGYYQSTRDASTNFFFDRIPKGVFIVEYDLRVNATGNFSNGITTIESMYAPALRSYTKGTRIQVN